MIGTRLGSYEITAKLGEGGMGEVWRARDLQLGREVALKVLPEALTGDAERAARFEREAKVLASLNHPNIAQIYGLESSGERKALIMELVEGPTLADRLEQGPIPFGESLAIARQIAAALEEAHEKGIVHRDLKPQNVKASVEGMVKVLDFGLAKAMEPGGSASGGPVSASPTLMNSPTLTAAGTQLGVILGTAAYMSPEQARGGAVDKRSDIWAFGVVLWEMLTGRSLFAADTVSDTLAGVLKTEIDFSALPATTPPAIRRLLGRCLERNPKNRLHDIADARIVLDEVESGKDTEVLLSEAEGRSPRNRAVVAVGGAALLALGLAVGAWLGRSSGTSGRAEPKRLSLVFPDELEVAYARLVPDGSAVLLAARRRDDPGRAYAIYRRGLGEEDAALLRGTERLRGFVPTPDGRAIVFGASTLADSPDRRLLRVPIDGSQPPVEIARWDPSWTDHNLLANGDPIVVIGRTKLLRLRSDVASARGEAVEVDVGRPAIVRLGETPPLPDGRLFLDCEGWSEHGWEGFTALVDPATGKGSVVLPDGGRAQFVPPDRILFARRSTLLGARFDPRKGEIEGAPVALLEGLRIGEAWETGQFRLASDGTLAYNPGGLVGAERRYVILDPASGHVEPWSAEARAFRLRSPDLSRDGRWVYAQLANAAGTYEIWRLQRTGPAQPVVAFPKADAQAGEVSPDGSTVAFAQVAKQPSDGIYLVPSDRSAPPRELLRIPSSGEESFRPEGWTPDGRRLLVLHRYGGENSVRELAVDAPSEPRVVVPAPAWDSTVSPDGRHLAFGSDVSGREEVYVADYDPEEPIGERFAVSREGGGNPAWSPDGRTLYFSDLGSKILAAAIDADGRPAGEPRVVADRDELRAHRGFEVLPDGRLILLQRGPREDAVDHVDLVLHFDRILEERLP